MGDCFWDPIKALSVEELSISGGGWLEVLLIVNIKFRIEYLEPKL